MPIIAITREMGSLGKDVARALGAELKLPVVYHEVIDHLADRMRVRKSYVIRLLEGKAGLLERLSADQTSMSIFTADEIIGNAAQVADEIRANDDAHGAIMRRHFGLQWTDSENYDLVLNTQRLAVEECVTEVLALVRSPQFAETMHARLKLADLALTAAVRAALRRARETRDAEVRVSADSGRVTLSGVAGTDQMLAVAEVASAVSGVRDVVYRTHPGEELRPRFH